MGTPHEHPSRLLHRSPIVVALGLTVRFGVMPLPVMAAEPDAYLSIRGEYRLMAPSQQNSLFNRSQLRKNSNRQVETVTLVARNEPIADVLEKIAKQAGLPLLWSRDQVPLNGKVSVSFNNTSIAEALTMVLRGTDAEAKRSSDGKTIVIVRKAGQQPTVQQTTAVVVGTVTDSTTRSRVARVAVTIVGTPFTTITSDKGEFSVAVPAGTYTVQFKLFGYRLVERRIEVAKDARVSVNVIMAPTATVLSGVVTTITGTQRRLEVSSDITTLNVDSLMTVAPIRSVTDLLESRVPGLQVLRTTGTPGDPSRLRLRGAGSINGSNAPIVVVDGIRVYAPDDNTNGVEQRDGREAVHSYPAETSLITAGYPAPSPLDQIDPNSIERIEVFKGPSASALYGADAANGVIVITTKRGRAGETRWSIASNVGTSTIPKNFPIHLYAFGHMVNEPSQICVPFQGCIIDSLIPFQALNDSRYSPLGRGISHELSTTVSGGTQLITYSVTGSLSQRDGLVRLPGLTAQHYTSVMGVAPPLWMRRPERYESYSGNSAFQLLPKPSLTVLFNTSLSASEQRRSSLSMSAGGQLLQRYVDPLEFVVDPLLVGYFERVTAATLTSRNDVSVQWRLKPTIPVSIRAGVNPNFRNGKSSIPRDLPRALKPGFAAVDTLGTYSGARATALVTSAGANTVIPLTLMHGIQLRLGLGMDLSQSNTSEQVITTRVLPKGISDPSTFDPVYTTVSQSGVVTSTYGWFLAPELTLGSRLFVQPGLRFDGGSATGKRAGLMQMPKVGFSWIALDRNSGESSRIPWFRFVSQLKLRATVGHAGNQPRPEQHARLYTLEPGTVDGGGHGGLVYFSYSLGNTRLRPERAVELEGGFDASLLSERLSVSATWYRKNTRDAILSLDAPPSVGYPKPASYPKNIGNIQNTGFELSTNARLIDFQQVQWDANIQFSQRRNRLVAFAPGVDTMIVDDGTRLLRVGYPLNGFWARPIAGYADENGDGKLLRSEVVLADSSSYLGSSDPRYQSVFSTTLSLLGGRLSINAAADYQNGFTQYNTNASTSLASAASAPDASLQQQAMFIASYSTLYYHITTVNTFRIQSFSVSYRLPTGLVKLASFRNADVAVQGRNLWIRTNYGGSDPNVNVYSSGNLVADSGQFPQPREWTLRLTLSR